MSKSKYETPLTLICHPYLFALKEGLGISQNMMDYHLLLLQKNCSEVLRSPIMERFQIKPNEPLHKSIKGGKSKIEGRKSKKVI